MPGNYTITTRAAGTIVTDTIYNSDHQVHVNGRDAPGMGSLSNAVAQMQRMTDPYPSGTESLSPSLSGEIERLRFEMNSLKATLRGGSAPNAWYEFAAPGLTVVGAQMWQTSNQLIPTAVPTALDFTSGVTSFNTNSVWSGANPTRFTAPFKGKYLASCVVLFSQFNAGGSRSVELGKNGSSLNTPRQSMTQANTAHFQYLNFCVPVDLDIGDYVEFIVRQTSGSNLFIIGNSNGVATPTQTQYTTGTLVLIGSNM